MAGKKGKSPLVSICIPTYKRHNSIGKVLSNVLKQSYENIEIIVIDDNNPNSSERKLTEEVIRSFDDKRIKYVKNIDNLGASYSRNVGIEQARGEYLAFLDDDDEWHPDKLGKQVEKFLDLKGDYGIVYSWYDYLVGGAKVNKKKHSTIEGDFEIFSLRNCPFGMLTVMVKKNFLDMVGGFDISFRSLEDWDLWVRLSKVCKVSFIPEVLAYYNVHGNQLSSDIQKTIDGRKKILEKHFEKIAQHPEILSWHYRRLGSLLAFSDKKEEANLYFRLSIKSNKFSFGTYFHLILLNFNKKLHKYVINKKGFNNIKGVRIIN